MSTIHFHQNERGTISSTPCEIEDCRRLQPILKRHSRIPGGWLGDCGTCHQSRETAIRCEKRRAYSLGIASAWHYEKERANGS